jgi:hypothetical protein
MRHIPSVDTPDTTTILWSKKMRTHLTNFLGRLGLTDEGTQVESSDEDVEQVPRPTKRMVEQPALSDTTQTALWTLGNQFESMGLALVNPFQSTLDATRSVKPLTQQFLEELTPCDLGFSPPQAPTGADELERSHRQAACIEDHKAREVALKRAMNTDEDFLAQLRVAETSYRTYVETLNAPLHTSYAVGQTFLEALKLYDDHMIRLCSAMKSHDPLIGIDMQLGIHNEGRRVRALIEEDLIADLMSPVIALTLGISGCVHLCALTSSTGRQRHLLP